MWFRCYNGSLVNLDLYHTIHIRTGVGTKGEPIYVVAAEGDGKINLLTEETPDREQVEKDLLAIWNRLPTDKSGIYYHDVDVVEEGEEA